MAFKGLNFIECVHESYLPFLNLYIIKGSKWAFMALGESLFWASIFLEDIYFSGVKFWSFFFVFSIMTIFRGFSILRGRIDIGLPLLQILLFLGLCFTCLSFLFLFFTSFFSCYQPCLSNNVIDLIVLQYPILFHASIHIKII